MKKSYKNYDKCYYVVDSSSVYFGELILKNANKYWQHEISVASGSNYFGN